MAIGNMHKILDEDWMCSYRDMLTDRHRQTDILVTILCSPATQMDGKLQNNASGPMYRISGEIKKIVQIAVFASLWQTY